MIIDTKSYELYFKFIETHNPKGFIGIDRNDTSLLELEKLMESNKQFFFVGDILRMKINYTSSRCIEMIGIQPDELTPYHFRESVHPDDAQRQGSGTTQLFKIANELFMAKKGSGLLSTNLRMRNSIGHYSDILFQCYLFYSDSPIRTVHILQIHTDIEYFKKSRNNIHYYVGSDLSYFRYPDEELLRLGNPLSDREFEIVKLIEKGLNSEKIAEKLFLSIHTINTHRSNIVNKTGYNTIAELIIDFQKQGIL
jgi:DNA-binding CsgD family transcriptional regulator